MTENPAAVNGTELSGLAAIVTGGGSGIGRATARLLAARGARVGVLDLNPGGEFAGFKADVTDDASVRAAVEQAADRLGGIDILVNNAGIGAIGTVADNPTMNGTGCSTSTWSAWSGPPAPRCRSCAGRARGDRQHLLGRGDRGAAAADPVLGHQGRGAVADAGDGGRPHRRGHQGQLR